MFVHPDHRRRGLGERLLRAAIDHARTWEGVERLGLGVSETTPAARRLYERLGFGIWGTEPDALRYAGRSYAEHYLSLELR
jgi:ribosomal protein S18 acetylase RimI-like enzyme